MRGLPRLGDNDTVSQSYPYVPRTEPLRTEPTPWGLGLVIAAWAAVASMIVLVGLYELIAEFHPAPALITVILVAAGLGWTEWELRDRSGWRWVVWGSLLGMTVGIVASIVLLIIG